METITGPCLVSRSDIGKYLDIQTPADTNRRPNAYENPPGVVPRCPGRYIGADVRLRAGPMAPMSMAVVDHHSAAGCKRVLRSHIGRVGVKYGDHCGMPVRVPNNTQHGALLPPEQGGPSSPRPSIERPAIMATAGPGKVGRSVR